MIFPLALLLMLGWSAAALADELPDGFVYLHDIAPGIRQEMRYAGADNFTNAPVPGYDGAHCILAKPVAEALGKVQQAMVAEGFSLVVFDCYRPARSVQHFVEWAANGGKVADPIWHPRVERSKLIEAGYIAARSGHSSGGSVDLGFGKIAPDGSFLQPDMGGIFDLFDPLSHTASKSVSHEAQANRKLLVGAMQRQGFSNYKREWWHFRFRNEPFAGKAFDFVVPASR